MNTNTYRKLHTNDVIYVCLSLLFDYKVGTEKENNNNNNKHLFLKVDNKTVNMVWYLCRKENMMRQFDQLDKDNSGVLEAEELRDTLMHTAGLKEYMATSLIDDFDLNKDKKINKKEFIALWVNVFGGAEAETETEAKAEAPPGESTEQAEQSENQQDATKKGD